MQPEHLNQLSGYPLKVMMWGCLSSLGTSQLDIVQGTVNSAKYVTTLENYLVPKAEEWFGQTPWVFQHTSRETKHWFEVYEINVLP